MKNYRKILSLGDSVVVYGPYKRKDGRSIVVHYNGTTKKRRTQSYPWYLMELKLGRELHQTEHVDHIDENPRNNDIDNLQILSQRENILKSVKPALILKLNCLFCNKQFNRAASQERWSRSVGRTGPYCSKRCSGKGQHRSK